MSSEHGMGRTEQLVQAIASRVANLVLEAIDVDALIHRLDVESIVERVDVEAIVERVDVERLIDRVDVDAIVQRVDVNSIVSRIDIDSLVENTELGSIIAKSTTGVLTEVLDVVRAQGVGLDDLCARWTNRALRRSTDALPAGPVVAPKVARATPLHTHQDGESGGGAAKGFAVDPTEALAAGDDRNRIALFTDAPPPPQLTVERQGQYAGAVSRLAAFATDVVAVWGIYAASVALVSFAVDLITSRNFDLSKRPVVAAVTVALWVFTYFAYQWAVAGRTVGMALFGLRVVNAVDGGPINGRKAMIRTLTLPLSLIALFLGCLGILTNRGRQAWHDRFAGTAVVYAWDARAARLRWLAETAESTRA
jgi:uncharacterized RDD family membrane protein YckC